MTAEQRPVLAMYLDDLRDPPEYPGHNAFSFFVVRSYKDAIAYVGENGVPPFISFDHDLGDEKSGFDFAKYLVWQDLEGAITLPCGFDFCVHSANPIGAENIESLLRNYLMFVKHKRGGSK